MILLRSGLALAATLGSAAPALASPEPPLDDLIAFADPAMCYLAPDALRLFGSLVAGSGDTLRDDWILPGAVEPRLRDRLGPVTMTQHDGWRSVETAARGTLWGLSLHSIAQEFPEGGDPGGFTLVFAASPRQVERAARRRGFVARAGRSVQMGPPDALRYEISLMPSPDVRGRSLLSCRYSG